MAVTIVPFNPGQPFMPFEQAYRNADLISQTKQRNIQNQFLPENLRIANALKQNELDFAPGMSAAELKLKQQMAPYYGALTGEANARIPLIGAQVREKNIENQFLPENLAADLKDKQERSRLRPLDYLFKAQAAQQAASRFGGAYQMAKGLQEMSPEARAAWIATNQNDYNQMLSDLGNKQSENLITPQALNNFFPGIAPQQMQQAQQPMQPPQGQQIPMGMPQQVQAQAPRFGAMTPEQNERIRLASEMAANRYSTTAATRRQVEGAVQVQNIINDPKLQNRAENASIYAGMAGKGKAALDAFNRSNPKAYEDYLNFKNVDMVLLNNRIKTLDQMGGTDKQREELLGLYDKAMDSFTSNPARFMDQFEKLKESLDNVARGVQKSATPIFNVNRLQQESPKQVSAKANLPDGTTRTIGGKTYRVVNGEWHE